ATGQKKYQKGFDPIPGGFLQVPFNDLEAAKMAISKNTAAIIVEPVQGEGGVNPAEKDYLEGLRKLCDDNDVLLIFDEIQCGIGRTGEWFAKDHYGVQPDIITLAKGLGGGMPIGAFLCNEKVAEAIDYGDHGTTFGGNPLAAAASLATLRVVADEKLCESARSNGKWLREKLEGMSQRHPVIKEIRGLGLMIGVQLNQ